MLKRPLLLLLLCFALSGAYAQRFEWNLHLDTRFDNREFDSELSRSKTIFGLNLMPEVGLGWGHGHSVMLGGSVPLHFGAPCFEEPAMMLAYYRYNSPLFRVHAGVFPHNRIMGLYTETFFDEEILFLRPYVSGALFQLVRDRNFLEIGCDWNSKSDGDRREKFTLFGSGKLNMGVFYLGFNYLMHHRAGSEVDPGVVDNVWVQPLAGLDLSKRMWLDSLVVQGSWLQSFQNDRENVGQYARAGGYQIETRLEKHRFGIYNTFYKGDNLMPYYPTYGSDLYWNNPFYQAKWFDRVEVYWNAVRTPAINLKLSTVHIYDGRVWNWQQLITFKINLNRKSCSSK